jgi:hypothetical protein
MTGKEVIAVIEEIEEVLGNYEAGVQNNQPIAAIEDLIKKITDGYSDEGFVLGKLESIRNLTDALYGSSRYKKYAGGIEQAKFFILSDCANIKHYISRQGDDQ